MAEAATTETCERDGTRRCHPDRSRERNSQRERAEETDCLLPMNPIFTCVRMTAHAMLDRIG